MTDIDFTAEESDPEFMRLIDQSWTDIIDHGMDEDEANAPLYAYGAWLEEINGTMYFRHPSRKEVQS